MVKKVLVAIYLTSSVAAIASQNQSSPAGGSGQKFGQALQNANRSSRSVVAEVGNFVPTALWAAASVVCLKQLAKPTRGQVSSDWGLVFLVCAWQTARSANTAYERAKN